MKTSKQKTIGAAVREYAVIVIGACVYATGLSIFIQPSLIPMGGIAGISLLLNYLFELPIGVMSLALNVPLFVIGYRILGREFFFKTLTAIVVSAVFIDSLSGFLPAYSENTLLAALYGGIVMGAGFGMIFRAGGTSGGTDVLAKYINRKWDVPLGTTNLMTNAVIIGISAVIYQSYESALYAIITTYMSGLVIDKIIFGADLQKKALIITSMPGEVSEAVLRTLKRGVTAIDGRGMYTGQERAVLLCVVRRHETGTLKRLIGEIDDSAFVLLSDVSEVFGQGFKSYGQ